MKGGGVVVAIAVLAAGCGKRNVATTPPPVVVSKPEPPPATQPAKRSRRAAAAPPAQTAVPPAAIPPALESMTTVEEKRDAVDRVNASISRAQANLATLRNRPLNPEDARQVARVDSFLRQARAAQQANDLITAREYAQRAEVLSQDLLKR